MQPTMRWAPPGPLSKQEERLMRRLGRVRSLFAFFRTHREELFDEGFQEQLAGMYRQSGAGQEAVPPAVLCMALLLQGYVGASDAEAVELTVVDLRWQMNLDCLGAGEPLFAQGTLQAFRDRLVAHDLDRVLLERTVTLVRAHVTKQKEADGLVTKIRAAIDSRPLAGAGRVEDTINLLGHAAKVIVRVVANILSLTPEQICRQASCPLLLAPSIKAGLDINWSDARQKATAIEIVERQVSSLHAWVEKHLDVFDVAPLRPYLDAITVVKAQDLERSADGKVKIRQGVAADRRISIEDAEMRHGRKSKSKRFDGYKEHIARELDVPVIVAAAVTPANRPEEEGAGPLADDIARQRLVVMELHVDRAYVNSALADQVSARGGKVIAKPWAIRSHRPGLHAKSDFHIDLRSQTITCPTGQVEHFEPGETVHFDPEACGACPERASCTLAASGRGRSVSIAKDEARQRKFRALQATTAGRKRLRERVVVEHSLARIANRKGPVARYRGVRKNVFDLRRACAIQNLEYLHMLGKIVVPVAQAA